eukprot:TRINITY_DN565_c0_g1_i1.p1 TRINITY_DN565_c0_g1~~TRINITY_DN565_c0_g1_i1.p1  ORF type:complete len:338 (-),score=42.85 TRINITY_DN565_c0_g1_i1:4306-5178(-)
MVLKLGMFQQNTTSLYPQKLVVNNHYRNHSLKFDPLKGVVKTNQKRQFLRSIRIIKCAQIQEIDSTNTAPNFNYDQSAKNHFQTRKYGNFFASVSNTQEHAIQRVKEMKFFVEKWMNVLAFFAPFCLLAVGVFVLVKSMFGFAGVVGDYYEGEKQGKDVKTMIAENRESLRMQREQKKNGVIVDQTAEEFKEEIVAKDQLIRDLQQQQKSVTPKPKEIQEEEQELKKLDPTQDFLQSAVDTDGIKVVSDQKNQFSSHSGVASSSSTPTPQNRYPPAPAICFGPKHQISIR